MGGLSVPIADKVIRDAVARYDRERDRYLKLAARVSDITAFFTLRGPGEPGYLVEVDTTQKIFTNPSEKRTEDYITGRFG